MGRMYTVTFTDIAVTAAQDFFEIGPVTNKPVRIAGIFLSQSSDVGDAAEEILSVSLVRVTGTVTGGGGTAVTPVAIENTMSTAGFNAERNATSQATGTLNVVHSWTFNIRAGLEFWFPPECRPAAIMGDTSGEPGFVLRLNAAPADSLTMSGTMYVEEEG